MRHQPPVCIAFFHRCLRIGFFLPPFLFLLLFYLRLCPFFLLNPALPEAVFCPAVKQAFPASILVSCAPHLRMALLFCCPVIDGGICPAADTCPSVRLRPSCPQVIQHPRLILRVIFHRPKSRFCRHLIYRQIFCYFGMQGTKGI